MCEKEDLVQKNLKRTLNKSPFFELKVADFELDFHQFRQFGLCVMGRNIVMGGLWTSGAEDCPAGSLQIAITCRLPPLKVT